MDPAWMLPSLPGCQEATTTRGDRQCWSKQGRNMFSWCFLSPAHLVGALPCPHTARRMWQCWKELSLSRRAQVEAGMGRRSRHRELAAHGDIQLWPCWAGHSDVHSVCPPSETPPTNPPPPNQAALPQKAASANPTAFNLLIDTEAFPFIY